MKKTFLILLALTVAGIGAGHADTLSGSVVQYFPNIGGPDITVNLTTQGNLDWIHFDPSIDEKAGGSNFSFTGIPAGNYNNDPVASAWTNGSTNLTGSDDYGAQTTATGTLNWTAPVTGSFQLTAYLGGDDGYGALRAQTLTATLPGATTYTSTFNNSGASYGGNYFYTNAYTLNFTATAGDELSLSWSGSGALAEQDFIGATVASVAASTPEPSIWALLLGGMTLLGVRMHYADSGRAFRGIKGSGICR